jgi:hypothetical protein
MSTSYTGAIELGETGDVVIADVTIDDLDIEAWSASLPSGSIVAGSVITGEMRVRIVDGDRVNQAATAQLDVSDNGDRVLRGLTRFA